jgi:hypothetical protein
MKRKIRNLENFSFVPPTRFILSPSNWVVIHLYLPQFSVTSQPDFNSILKPGELSVRSNKLAHGLAKHTFLITKGLEVYKCIFWVTYLGGTTTILLITSSRDATSSLDHKHHDMKTIFQFTSHGGNNILSDSKVSS